MRLGAGNRVRVEMGYGGGARADAAVDGYMADGKHCSSVVSPSAAHMSFLCRLARPRRMIIIRSWMTSAGCGAERTVRPSPERTGPPPSATPNQEGKIYI